MKKTNRNIIGILILLFGVAILSSFVFKRFDMTHDKRYTLTDTTKSILNKINQPLRFNILLGGELPGDYRTLKNEISFMLDEFRNINPNISYQFSDPSKDYTTEELQKDGLAPAPVKTDKGVLNVYPYAYLQYGKKGQWMETLINDPGLPFNQLASATTEKLEFLFMGQLRKISQIYRKRVGLIIHHDELPKIYLEGLGSSLAENYDVEAYINPIKDSTYSLKQADIDSLKRYDALIVAKPTLPFTDSDKLVLDQYVMNGGKMLWMTEMVDAEMDSIFRSGKIVAFPRDLNLNDFFFNYGMRIIPAIVKDAEAAKIILADGETTAGNVSYNAYTWPYFVRGFKADASPITQNINSVEFRFANPIEILENPYIKPTVLLATSLYTTLQPSMSFIELKEVDDISPEEYKMGRIPLAVLAEGNFKSMFAARFERKEIPNFKSETQNGKLILISDGDVAKNDIDILTGGPLPLGADKFSRRPDNPKQKPLTYDNQNFLLNCIDYLVGDTDFLNLKNRKFEIPTLNETKVRFDKSDWQMKNLLIPLFIIAIFGSTMTFLHKRKYRKTAV